TLRIDASQAKGIVEDQLVMSAGNYAVSAPLGTPGHWIMQMLALRAAAPATPPGAPANLAAAAMTATQIDLNWKASISTVGLKNYIVQRCQGADCSNFVQIGVSTGTTYSDTGLSAASGYSYQMQAFDTAGNLSLFSNVASATTQSPPTAPANLIA